MGETLQFLSDHAIWVWLAVGAGLLAAELATNSGYLLWPAGAAGATALATPLLHLGDVAQLVAFSTRTIAATYLGRRVLRPHSRAERDLQNDKGTRLVGRSGRATAPFTAGHGRVFVDGAEWAADLTPDAAVPEAGAVVQVVEVNGSRLIVRPSAG